FLFSSLLIVLLGGIGFLYLSLTGQKKENTIATNSVIKPGQSIQDLPEAAPEHSAVAEASRPSVASVPGHQPGYTSTSSSEAKQPVSSPSVQKSASERLPVAVSVSVSVSPSVSVSVSPSVSASVSASVSPSVSASVSPSVSVSPSAIQTDKINPIERSSSVEPSSNTIGTGDSETAVTVQNKSESSPALPLSEPNSNHSDTPVQPSVATTASPVADANNLNTTGFTSRTRFSVMAFFSPDNSNRFLNSSDNDESKETVLNEKEISAFSFSTGLKLGYELNAHWSFSAGLDFSTATQTIKSQTVYAEDDAIPHYCLKTSFGTIDLPNPGTGAPNPNDSLYIKTDSKLTLQFINLPLIARYTIHTKHFYWYGFAGLSVSRLVGEHIIIELPGMGGDRKYNVPAPEDVRKWNLGALAGLGMRYDLCKSLALHLEPTYRTALTSINTGSAVRSYPFTMGLSVGISYHFQ
ncbi:MAG TPA: outer membrane beta-barrel protein, partial [Bacteroidia bacterium]|nr:outer membrane beta-barrel protein [Bacteroidia bacterium]